MNLFPIVGRELRVAARKRSTFWVRVIAAGTGLTLGAGCLILSIADQTSRADLGQILFYALVWTCVVAGLSAGLFFTSDCLSEEKRQGTLGLLFLTPLRGYDVTLGKLLSTSVRAFYALLAVLPIAAIPFLLGGIAGEEYWRSALALLNALFFSLAAGMCVSALSRDSTKALAATLLLLLGLALVGPAADLIISNRAALPFKPVCSLTSPGWVLWECQEWQISSSRYWAALIVNQVLSWGMLAFASFVVPRTWQERKSRRSASMRSWSFALRYGSRRRRANLRRKLMGSRPMDWLARRETWLGRSLLFLAICAIIAPLALHAMDSSTAIAELFAIFGGLFTLGFYVMAAAWAGQFFVETRRGGFLELLLASPVNEREIVKSQWRAFRRRFAPPLLLFLSVQILSQISLQYTAWQAAAAAAPPSVAVTSSGGTNPIGTITITNSAGTNQIAGITINNATTTVVISAGSPPVSASPAPGLLRQLLITSATATLSALTTVFNLAALGWFGMWMGMTSRHANLAGLKTVLVVQILPWVVAMFAWGLIWALVVVRGLVRSGGPNWWYEWWQLASAVLGAVAFIGKDLAFIFWSRRRLFGSFRVQAARSFAPVVSTKPMAARPPPTTAANEPVSMSRG